MPRTNVPGAPTETTTASPVVAAPPSGWNGVEGSGSGATLSQTNDASTGSSLVAPAADQDLIFDHANGMKKANVTADVVLITPPAGCRYARIGADQDVFINTAGAAAVDNGTAIQIIANTPEIVPVTEEVDVHVMATAPATVRATPLKARGDGTPSKPSIIITGEGTPGEALASSVGPTTQGVISVQWLADDVVISGATEATYTVQSADKGKYLTQEVTWADGTKTASLGVAAADLFVDAADYLSNWADYAAGSVVAIRPGAVTLGKTDATHTVFDKSLTVIAAKRGPYDPNPLGTGKTWKTCFTRTVIFDGLCKIQGGASGAHTVHTFKGIEFQLQGVWPNISLGESWSDLGISKTAAYILLTEYADLNLIECRAFGGYGGSVEDHGRSTPTGVRVPYDPTLKYWDMNSPTPYFMDNATGKISPIKVAPYLQDMPAGWGDTDYPLFNAIAMSQSFVKTDGGWNGSFLARHTESSDMSNNYAFQTNKGAQTIVMEYCRTIRQYVDNLQISVVGPPGNAYVVHGCVIEDGHFDAKDNGNPHADVFQFFGNSATATQSDGVALTGGEMSNTLYFQRPTTRGGAPQMAFWQGSSDHQQTKLYRVEAPKLRNVIGIDINKFFTTDGAVSAYVRNCIGFTHDYILQAGSTPTAYADFERSKANMTAPDSLNYIKDSIMESIQGNGRQAQSNISVIGASGHRVRPVTDVFDDPERVILTANDVWNAFAPKTAGLGPQAIYPSLDAFLSAPRDWTGEQVFVGMIDATDVAASSAVYSNPAYVHGGDVGDMLAISGLSAGLAWRAVDLADVETAISSPSTGITGSDWQTGAGSILVGQYLQLRVTSAATVSTSTRTSLTVGGEVVAWNVFTASNNTWPEMSLDTPVRIANATLPGLGATVPTTSTTFWFAAEFNVASLAAASTLLIETTGANFEVILAGGGGITVLLRNGSNQSMMNAASVSVVTANTPLKVLISVDLSQPDFNSAYRLYVNDVRITSFVSSIYTPANGPILLNTGIFSALAGTNNGLQFAGSLKWMAMGLDMPNWDDPDVRAKATVDGIGPHAEGVTGVAPPLFIVADAEVANDGGNMNRNSASAWASGVGRDMVKQNTGSFTSVNTADFPPNLTLLASADVDPVAAGQPVTVTITPTGTPRAINITGSASGVSGTWTQQTVTLAEGAPSVTMVFTPSSSGALTLSFANDGGYTNPADLSVTVN